MQLGSWSDQEQRAVRTMFEARPGDEVVWADRSIGMQVEDVRHNEDDRRELIVSKPRAPGRYVVEEQWDENDPDFRSEIGKANNLRFISRGNSDRGLTEVEVDDLIGRLSENAVDSFMRLDYSDWNRATADVVEDWAQRVSLRDWRGYRHHPDWEDGDAQAIFRSVVDALEDQGDEPDDPELTVRERAEILLQQAVFEKGRLEAERSIVQTEEDYRQLIQTLAHHTVDRIDRKNYPDARRATRDTVSDWIDDRQEPAYEAIIEYGENPFEGDDLYADEEEIYADDGLADLDLRERAFDTLDDAVWDEVKEIQRERGDYDPTLRGMTREQYWETVDVLAGRTLRRWDDGFLRTTAKEVVNEWADRVENAVWGAHRFDAWADGDVEDIFASAAIHSDEEPFVWNPFSSKKERKMAVQVLISDVVAQAEDTYDEGQPETEPVPADEYVDDVLGVDLDWEEIKQQDIDDLEEVAERAIEATTGDEVGWTFVDEIVRSGGTVIEMTNNWVLVDYGVIREGETLRKLAWFDRTTGDVLVLSGQATEPPHKLADADRLYDQFHVTYHENYDREPEYICQDVPLGAALDCVYDFLDASQADFKAIETPEDMWIQEQITEEDLDVSGVVGSLVPNLPFGASDALTVAEAKSRGLAEFTTKDFAPELARLSSYIAVAALPKVIGDRVDGIKVDPIVDSNKGIGTKISKEFGMQSGDVEIGGKTENEIYVTNETFVNLIDSYAPGGMTAQAVNREGDLGKGVLRRIGDGLDDVKPDATEIQYESELARKVWESTDNNRQNQYDIDYLADQRGDLNRLQEIHDELGMDQPRDIYTGQVDREQGNTPGTTLSQKIYGNIKHNLRTEVQTGNTWTNEARKEYLGSLEAFLNVVREGSEDRMDEVGEDVGEWTWEDLERQDIALSAMLIRGLDAEALVAGAEFFDVDDWIDDNLSVEFDINQEDPPTYEEWKQQHFGVGRPPGPEAEARMKAKYFKQVAAADPEAADPFEALGIDREMVEEESDYDQAIYDFDDTFGETFEDVEERFARQENEMAAEEFERSLDNMEEGQNQPDT